MKNKKYLYLLLIIMPIIIFFVARSFSLEYTQEIKSVEIESDDYDDPGSWHINKSAKWVSFTEAEVNFDLNTIYKERENANYKDVIIVMDISGSMVGTKLAKAKSDAMELVDSLLSNSNNHVALISFDTSSEIISGFTNNKNEMLEMIENLTTKGCTNYNAGLLNVLEVMEDYQKDDSHDLVTLFLTDGYPNEDTPNQVATYNIIKDKYPYMTINGIQYEMGSDIIQGIIDISDNQFAANQETLNGFLFDAVITPLPYETFVVSDYVNKDYFYLDNINDVTVSRGIVALQEENGLQKIVWTLDDNLTGFNANMKIKLQLKSEYHNTRGFYPTNDHETIDYKIIDDEEENVSSTLTPVLKRTYSVIYDTNAPDGCTLPDIPSEEHYVYENVTKRTETLVCEGYVFKGYQFDSEYATNINIINNDTFIMPGHDVTIRGTWSQQGLAKSMDGTIHIKLNGKLKKQDSKTTMTFGKSIDRNKFETVTTVDNIYVPSNAIDSWDVSEERNGSVIAWYTDTDNNEMFELYIGQEDRVVANPDSSSAFRGFRKARVFDLSYFDTSNVTTMTAMFQEAGYGLPTTSSFEIIGLDKFDTSNVTAMNLMFDVVGFVSSSVNIGDISNWDTSNVTNMYQMFRYFGYNDQNLQIDLGRWNVSKVTDMSGMFYDMGYNATTWSIGDLSDWNTSSLKKTYQMFYDMGYNATTFDIGNLGGWDTSKVTNMSSMFEHAGGNATTFNIGDLSGWDTSQVTTMSAMFYYAGYNATTFDIGDLSDWDTSKVTNISFMFYYAGYNATTFDIGDLSGWNTSQVTSMGSMFYYAGYNATTWNVGDLSGWDTSKVTNMSSMFYSAGYRATTFDIGILSEWDTSQVTDMSSMFYSTGYNATTFDIGDLSGWDTSKVTSLNRMFYYAGYNAPTFDIGDLSGWNTSQVTNMSYMFYYAGRNATTFDIGDLSGWDTSQVTNMSNMFYSAGYKASTFELNLSGWDTSKVTNMTQMFYYAGYNATTFDIGDLNDWDTSQVTSMRNMFNSAGYLSTTWNVGDLSSWDTSQVTDMYSMFSYAGYGATTWNSIGTLKVYATNMSYMFSNCKNAKATLNIYSNPTTYTSAFSSAAFVQGSGITVNYSSATTNIDAIIATKSSVSNVVKGDQLD